ncbi:MAG: hypothetical protein DRJ01_06760 [Bacteroidetes bacterium]|nr:MAG: hypothetical protein DRJ01_06760 [Bacteroidota bacterium]
MKKFLLIILSSFFITNFSHSQVVGSRFEKLAKLYNEKRYEDCLYKSDTYTYKDKTKREAEPYLYMSMCYYQISKMEDPDILEDYPKALKNSIKYLIKFKRKDKKDEYFTKNIDFVNKIGKLIIDEANNYYKDKNYRKAATHFKQYSKLFPEDNNIKYMIGACGMLANNYSEGQKYISEAIVTLVEDYKSEKSLKNINTSKILEEAFILYSSYLVNDKKIDSAKSTINIAKQFFPNSGNITIQYNVINKVK